MYDEFNKIMDRIFKKNPEEYDLIMEATSRIEELDDNWEEVYESASDLGKKAMDSYARDFADGAIGDPSWRAGTDFED